MSLEKRDFPPGSTCVPFSLVKERSRPPLAVHGVPALEARGFSMRHMGGLQLPGCFRGDGVTMGREPGPRVHCLPLEGGQPGHAWPPRTKMEML